VSVLSDRERTRCGASQDSARQSRSAATARCTVVRSPLYPGHSIRGDRIRWRVAQIAVRGRSRPVRSHAEQTTEDLVGAICRACASHIDESAPRLTNLPAKCAFHHRAGRHGYRNAQRVHLRRPCHAMGQPDRDSACAVSDGEFNVFGRRSIRYHGGSARSSCTTRDAQACRARTSRNNAVRLNQSGTRAW